MTDIFSTYYNSYYPIRNNPYKKEKIITQNITTEINSDLTEKKLSSYGIYLSQNNFFLLSKKEKLPQIPIIINNNSNDTLKEESKNDLKDAKENDNNNSNKGLTDIDKEHKDNNNSTNYKNDKIKKRKEYLKLRTELIDFNNSKDYKATHYDSKQNAKRNKTYSNNLYKKISNNRYKYYKEDKKEKEENNKKAEKIVNELLSLSTKRDIKNYYIKKDLENNKKEEFNPNNIFFDESYQVIDPMSYIKYNLIANPKKSGIFKSLDTQLMIFGSEKYRNNLLDGVNDYKSNVLKYTELKGPTGYDKNRIEEKKRKNIIKKMNNNFLEKRGMVFTSQNFKKIKNKKKIFHFEYDENYKNLKKLFNKDIDRYENEIAKNILKKKNLKSVTKKDIKIMNNLDSDAELIIRGNDDIIKFSKKFLSFDEKLKKLYNKTLETTGYLFKRTKQYQKIKTKIDQLYKIE